MVLLSGGTSQPTEAPAPPAAPPQDPATATQQNAPPVPAAQPGGAQAPAAAAPRAAGDDGSRLPQQTSPKIATVEATPNAKDIIAQAQLARQRESRESRLAAGREDDGLGDLSDVETRA